MDAVRSGRFAEADHGEPTSGDEAADGLGGHAEPFGGLGYGQKHAGAQGDSSFEDIADLAEIEQVIGVEPVRAKRKCASFECVALDLHP